MKQRTLETPTCFVLLRCGDAVEVLDKETSEVTAPDWLEGGRMRVNAWIVRDLIVWEDRAEIGIEGLALVSRISLN